MSAMTGKFQEACCTQVGCFTAFTSSNEKLLIIFCLHKVSFLYVLGLPKNFTDKDFKPPQEMPCIIQLLCEQHEGLGLEAKGIKEHWFKPYIKRLFDKKVGRS